MTDSTEMQTLRAWLTWATTETHVPAAARAERAPDGGIVVEAAAYMREHADGGADGWAGDVAWCLDHHPAAFRDLVLAWATAVEAMRAAVPEYVPRQRPPPPADACPACRAKPCEGTHMRCDLERYRAENPGRELVRIEPRPRPAWSYAVLMNFDPFCCTGCGCRDGEVHRPGCPLP